MAKGNGIPSPAEARKPDAKHNPPVPADALNFARSMRREFTDAEARLWRYLRSRGIEGFKFRRQHPFEGCILDFYCHEAKLALELDGGQHDDDRQVARDAARHRALARAGIRVLRFWNPEVLRNTIGVLEEIRSALLSRCPSPSPLPEGEGGDARGKQVAGWLPVAKRKG
jgi:very-short-patch-repair endonuclease